MVLCCLVKPSVLPAWLLSGGIAPLFLNFLYALNWLDVRFSHSYHTSVWILSTKTGTHFPSFCIKKRPIYGRIQNIWGLKVWYMPDTRRVPKQDLTQKVRRRKSELFCFSVFCLLSCLFLQAAFSDIGFLCGSLQGRKADI